MRSGRGFRGAGRLAACRLLGADIPGFSPFGSPPMALVGQEALQIVDNLTATGGKPLSSNSPAFHIPTDAGCTVFLAGAAHAPRNFRTAELPTTESGRGRQNPNRRVRFDRYV